MKLSIIEVYETFPIEKGSTFILNLLFEDSLKHKDDYCEFINSSNIETNTITQEKEKKNLMENHIFLKIYYKL